MLSCLSHVWLFATPWTVARQAYLSIGFSRQEYWSGLPCPPPGDLPDPGIKLTSFISPAPEQKQMMSEWRIQTGGVRSLGNYNIGIGQLTELRDWQKMNASSLSLAVSRPFQRKWQLSWALKRWQRCLRLRDYEEGSRRDSIPEAWEDEVNWKCVRSTVLPPWLSSRFRLQCRNCRRCGFYPRKISWRRKWQPSPVFFSGESLGQRSLAGYSPCGCKELDMSAVT